MVDESVMMKHVPADTCGLMAKVYYSSSVKIQTYCESTR